MKKNGLVNQVEFLGLACAFVTSHHISFGQISDEWVQPTSSIVPKVIQPFNILSLVNVLGERPMTVQIRPVYYNAIGLHYCCYASCTVVVLADVPRLSASIVTFICM